MADPIIKDTINRFGGDGVTTSYNFVFTGGYIETTHVRARALDAVTLEVLRAVPFELVGPYQVELEDPVPEEELLEIYRLTPRAPLVNFGAGTPLSEANLDLIAKQALFVAAEIQDAAGQDAAALDALLAAAQAAQQAAEDSALAAANVETNFGELESAVNGALIAMGDRLDTVEGLQVDLSESVDSRINGIQDSVDGQISDLSESLHGEVADLQDDVTEVVNASWRTAFAFYAPDRPDNNTTVFSLPVSRKLLLPEDLAGSRITFTGNPNADVTFTLYHNGVEIGSIEIAATSGTVTMVADETEFEDGDLISMVCTHAASSGAAQIGFNIVTRIVT